ncbi:hypothetical protein FQR65_LT06381 [Abscondita terminalis]|nr:hypothetical protein FQR65_LT06381 [Abscondita terminalis]
MPTFYKLVNELSHNKNEEPIEFLKHFKNVLLYNAPGGKLIRLRTMVTAYKIMESPQNLTPENMELAYILGWCIELLHSGVLINDDIIDASTHRRGVLCWYLLKGLYAINDARLLENAIFKILNIHFFHHLCYTATVELFHKALYKVYLGQTLDTLRPSEEEKLSFADLYTFDKYYTLVTNKTIFCTSELPILLALHLSNKYRPNSYKNIQEILTQIGFFFQVQNDIDDYFSDVSKSGKDGTDIQEGKCTWLIVTALDKATPTQKQILEENYGKKDSESVRKVLELYKELKIIDMHYSFKNNFNIMISEGFQNISQDFPETFLPSITDIICKSTFKK